MSYIKADEFQEALIENFKLVMNEKQLRNARFSYTHKKTKSKSYKAICKKACLNPEGPDVIVAWYHLGNRYLRGLI